MANFESDNEREMAGADSALAEQKRSDCAKRLAAGQLERAEKERREAEHLQQETQGQ